MNALKTAEIIEQEALRPYLSITDVTRVGDDETWIEARPFSQCDLNLQYRLDFGPDSIIGRETYRGSVSPKVFEKDLASARTFILEHEAEWLRSQGLAQRVTAQDVSGFW